LSNHAHLEIVMNKFFLVASITNALTFIALWVTHGFLVAISYWVCIAVVLNIAGHYAPRRMTRLMFTPGVAREVNDVLYPEVRS
jgi:hypothetical protein